MNFLCHALPYLDDPLVVAGTAVPDWLSVLDRRLRARGKAAQQLVESQDASLSRVATGVLRHHQDDRWFHGTRAFAETNLTLSLELRELLPGDAGFRPSFVGHILVEILLDSLWLRDDPSWVDRYYAVLEAVPAKTVEQCVAAIAGKPATGLVELVERFLRVRFLYDYDDHDKLLGRLNQVMRRVGLADLPDTVGDWLPAAAAVVEARRVELLSPPGASPCPPLPAEPERRPR